MSELTRSVDALVDHSGSLGYIVILHPEQRTLVCGSSLSSGSSSPTEEAVVLKRLGFGGKPGQESEEKT